ncbi:MAG TPA: hypothetical protein VHM91_25605 [Verrucomicrobiales bacterium]|nr:hypothetical protein [Verrucomicrobiales bacterium]
MASVFNHGGLIAEKPGGSVVVKFSEPAAIHSAILAALEACEYEETFNYSGRKKSDWPAWQASGCKTIKQFETGFVRLSVKGVNAKNLFYAVTTPEFGDYELHLAISVNAYGGHFGEAVHSIVKNYLACKAAVTGSSGSPP